MKSIDTSTQAASRAGLQHFRRQGFYFRYAAMSTLAVGAALHVISLLIGRELFLRYVLTPAVDMLLVVPMAYAAVTGWLVRPWIAHRGLWHRIVYWFLVLYFSVSTPVHLQTFITGRIDHVIRLFPEKYSLVILPVMLTLFVFVWRLRLLPTRRGMGCGGNPVSKEGSATDRRTPCPPRVTRRQSGGHGVDRRWN